MPRLGYHTVSDDVVSSSPCDTVQEGIDRALELLKHHDVDSAWVRNDHGVVVWRGQV